jgi:hypothetical protein
MLTHVFKPRWVVLILVSGYVVRGRGCTPRGGSEVSRGWNTGQGDDSACTASYPAAPGSEEENGT